MSEEVKITCDGCGEEIPSSAEESRKGPLTIDVRQKRWIDGGDFPEIEAEDLCRKCARRVVQSANRKIGEIQNEAAKERGVSV